ncbi:hypothetical protein [Spiroplasma culicicola]|uniref:Uncharacterized protein n=1 Tax=Spiroplasma culicicola AES-1 TaxID=1276246 RepID=W6AGW3_9MOLU|nr:hypothetical protein [Spiroplasma culicicola]AHI52929.1 hypothetical protein SCULI_v1c05880 [Spiroplasma culicicola AES-1]
MIFTKNTFINQDLIIDNQIHFKIQYDINIKNKKLIPESFEYTHELRDQKEEDIIKEQGLTTIYYFFSIVKQKDFNDKRTIVLYPKENIEVIKTSRFEVDQSFFLARGVSENNAKKSTLIFNDRQKSYSQCLKELKRIYVGSEFNLAFYSQAIPKLINPY